MILTHSTDYLKETDRTLITYLYPMPTICQFVYLFLIYKQSVILKHIYFKYKIEGWVVLKKITIFTQDFWPWNGIYYILQTNLLQILWFDFIIQETILRFSYLSKLLSYLFYNQLIISSINSIQKYICFWRSSACILLFLYLFIILLQFQKFHFFVYTIIYIKYPSTNPIVKKKSYRDRYKNWDI